MVISEDLCSSSMDGTFLVTKVYTWYSAGKRKMSTEEIGQKDHK